jgi:hypothetical protein
LKGNANKNDFHVVKVFEEEIGGAKRNKEREMLLGCVDYFTENEVCMLFASEITRIGRSTL